MASAASRATARLETARLANARFANADERADWNALVAANPGGGEVWAGTEYLEAKRHGRYRPYFVIVERVGRPNLAVGVLSKRVPLVGEWWHLPAGPPGEDVTAVLEAAAAVAALAALGRSARVFMMKVEPRIGPEAATALRTAGYRNGLRIIPNPSTVLVDVSGTEAELFARIGKKARNSINRAGRDGITAERVPASNENCAALYRLLQETAEGRFVLRDESYYRGFWQGFERAGLGQVFFATRDGALVAGAFAMALGEKTTYKDGASVRDKSAYGASHALQWEVLRWANERGATTHDLCGAPPASQADNAEHPLHGVGRFKRSFSPEIVDYVGAFDLPLKRVAYAFWVKIGDRIMRRWSLTVHGDPYY